MTGIMKIDDHGIIGSKEIDEATETIGELARSIDESNDSLDDLDAMLDQVTVKHGAYRIKSKRVKDKMRKLSMNL